MEDRVKVAETYVDYDDVVDDVTSTVTGVVPSSETVLVVSKGDDDLLRLGSRRGWHFPRAADGRYAGHYPADSADAIDQLETLREQGAGYIVFPATSLWWLDSYPDFSRHLESRYQCLVRDEICAIYSLGDSPTIEDESALEDEPSREEAAGGAVRARRLEVNAAQLTGFLDSLLPEEATVAVVSSGDPDVLQLGGREMWHFPRDSAGAYAGLAAVGTDAALDQLEGLRARGLEFLVVPRQSPWLSHYPDFLEHVERRYRCVARQRYLCSIYDLTIARAPRRQAPPSADGGAPRRRWLRLRRARAAPERG
jgi:hypothetical protein